ncbi:MAG: TerB family tellurite resistance protein [Alphaproteobacteria bacterium]|nr:TerB family tellurite resistance protein [Alphaproteobacteria bacterium]MCB9696758.1 TerB family tellurite resistance protein [Alphaproteobacteria bacterium]
MRDLPDDRRLAAIGLLLCAAGADGVVDDDELWGLVGDLRVQDLGEGAQALVARWFADAPAAADVAGPLRDAPSDVRAGLVLRALEVVVSDGVLADREREQVARIAEELSVSADQLDALHALVGDLIRLSAGIPELGPRERVLRGAGSTLAASGVPAGALRYSGLLEPLEGLGPLLEAAGGDPELLGDRRSRARGRAEHAADLRDSMEALLAAMHRREQDLDEPRATAAALRRRSLERRLRPLTASRG